MIRKFSIVFSVIFTSFMLGTFHCGCKSQIPDEAPSTVKPANDISPHWNPSGSSIAFSSDRDGNQEIYVMDINGSNQIRLTNDPSADCNYPIWSPYGSKIAYSSFKEGCNDIYVVNADGSDKTNLTDNSPNDWFESWSPNGEKIAFQSIRDGNWEIYVMNADGSDQARLTDNPSRDEDARWSPDGSRIVYAAHQEIGHYDIYTMDPDGSNKSRLTDNPAMDRNPLWSPNGEKIIFQSNRDGSRGLYIMNIDGSDQRRLADNLAGPSISLSADGSRIAFATQEDDQMDIFTVEVDGSILTRLTNQPGDDRNPVWSPDGKMIVFFSNRTLGILGDIYTMDSKGTDLRNLTRNDRIPGERINDIKYGEHERNILDLWLARADEPTPLVIFYHGGGFRAGDKRRSMPVPLLLKLLEAGISVAGVNYRLTDSAPFPAQMHDSARALQFIRHHAGEHNIDPSRIGATGGSAGAHISMWLAFHDDLADPDNEDPICRESTRLTAIVPTNGPTSVDPRFIQELFDTDQFESALIPFFGMSGPKDIHNPEFFPLFEKASPINYASPDDPPVYMYYGQENLPLPPNSTGNQHIHHPKFGIVLKEKLDSLGVECILKFRKDYPDGPPFDEYVKFFREKFGMAENKERRDILNKLRK